MLLITSDPAPARLPPRSRPRRPGRVRGRLAAVLLSLSAAALSADPGAALAHPKPNRPAISKTGRGSGRAVSPKKSRLRLPRWSRARRQATVTAPRYPKPRYTVNEVALHYDGDCFTAMESMVGRAQKSIKIDFYLFGGPTAHRIVDTLIAKAQSGVDVKVMVDSHDGYLPAMRREIRPVLRRLEEAGIDVVRSRGKIDHNKVIVVDDQEALVGSMNLAEKFYRYHDLVLEVKGPAAADVGRQYDHDWFYSTNRSAPLPDSDVVTPNVRRYRSRPDGRAWVRVVGTGIGRKSGQASLVGLLRRARSSVYVQMHELGPGPVLSELIAAHRRGVEVKVLLDPGDLSIFMPKGVPTPKGMVNARALAELLEAGIEVHDFIVSKEVTTAHLKAALIDGEVLYAGSINWTKGGFESVYETNLEVHGGQAPRDFLRRFRADWGNSVASKIPSKALYNLSRLKRALAP